MPKKDETDRPSDRLEIREATQADVDAISHLVERVYPGMPPYPKDMLRAQVASYPEGHMVALFNGEVVGYCATIRLPGERALAPHNWKQVTGGGYGTTHDAKGDFLYGYEVCVDPAMRRYRIGQRFYRARKKLCRAQRLRGVVIVGRIPNYHRRAKDVSSPEEYVQGVIARRFRDPVLNFQLRQGYEFVAVLKDYLPLDKASLGYGAQLVWRNSDFDDRLGPAVIEQRNLVDRVRVASVQYRQRRITEFDEFVQFVRYFVDTTADYGADFVLFPELFTLQLLSIENEELPPHVSIERLTGYEERLKEMFHGLALKYNINIIGGSTPSLRDGAVHNVSHVFLRDGRVITQDKIHPTPNERFWWNIVGGQNASLIETDCGPIGVLICYDCEFPELVRHLVNQGVNILFVPFLTDERQSYLRVRYCAQARAVENQIYVALSGSCGNLPNVHNNDIHYAQSCILTPCDFPFARDGIAADTTPNSEMVAIADLSLRALREARQRGTVRNLLDRRHDLYSIQWHGR
ncbi:MAG: carbon-nitrogen hydrolase family protein [Steroidobacteraceae bacterium]|nr:carbon-nitrogen hydrolase family protein [Steroidobacteraceae bacterium]